MILAVHGGSVDAPEDVEAAFERIHPATMAAEGPLHELGAISIVNSDSQGMGRIGETVRRTFQLAHVMKGWRASELGADRPEAPRVRRLESPPAASGDRREPGDNERVLRYLAKVTVEPALTHGIGAEVGTLAPGRLADVVLWHPARFGVRPELVLKGGWFSWGAIGQGNAAVEAAEPIRYGSHWGAMGEAASRLSVTFVSRAALDSGIRSRLGSHRRFVAVEGTRSVRREELVANRAVPQIEVDRIGGTVRLDGRVLACEPVDEVPLSRRYLLA
jgi:urease subunit alpha